MGSISTQLLVLVFLAILNGVFAMAEIAIVSARRARLEAAAREGDRRAKVALDLSLSPNTFLPTVQIGITLVGILSGVYGGATLTTDVAALIARVQLLAPYAEPAAFAVVVVGITYLSLVLGELIPKRIGLAYPETIARLLSLMMVALSKLFSPLVKLLDWSTELVLRALPKPAVTEPEITEDEIKMLLEKGTESGVLDEVEYKILRRVFRLPDRSVASVMTPRNELLWIDLDRPAEDAWRIVLDARHSFYPACRESIDNVVGVIAALDIARCMMDPSKPALSSVVQEPIKIPSTSSCLTLVQRFEEQNRHIALVIDEFGSLDGLITTHDLMDSLVGDVSSEEPGPDATVTRRADGSLLVDAAIEIEELMALLEIDDFERDPRSGYHSLGGFVMTRLGQLPREGDLFEFRNFRFEVVDMDRFRIDKVLISKIEPPRTPPSEGDH